MQKNYNGANPIKIVYNWIGPQGPIINTELPNILQIIAVTESVTMHDHSKFWTEDLWWRIFLHNDPFVLSSTMAIDEHDAFIYPLSLVWRINFSNYFLGTTGILEYAHTPHHIIYNVRNHKGFFMIDLSAEAFVQDSHLTALHTYFGSTHGIPLGKIIYLTGCMNAREIYDEWCNKNNIPDDPTHRIKMVSFPVSQHGFAVNLALSEESQYDVGSIPEKLFLMWNRRYRPHRTSLVVALDKTGLVDRSYVSMGAVDPENPNVQFINKMYANWNETLNITLQDVNNFIRKLPLSIDSETDIIKMCGDFTAQTRTFYQNSLISIVTETNFDEAELTLTEKSFKPSREKHPFIIVGVRHALKTLKEYGFQTFSEFWDESYDDTVDARERMKKIVEVCEYIGTWDHAKILDFKQRVKPILENNFKAIQFNTAQMVAQTLAQIVKKHTGEI